MKYIYTYSAIHTYNLCMHGDIIADNSIAIVTLCIYFRENLT